MHQFFVESLSSIFDLQPKFHRLLWQTALKEFEKKELILQKSIYIYLPQRPRTARNVGNHCFQIQDPPPLFQQDYKEQI